MKKLLLLSAVLLGAGSVAHAGVRLDIGIPLPPLPGVVVTPPAACPPAVYGAPSVVVRPPYLSFGYSGYDNCYRGPYYGHYYGHGYYPHHHWDYRRYGHGYNHHYGHGRW